MSYTMSEEKVLKKLGINSFRELSKDNVVKFASMIPHMSEEVAKAAIAQFPEFSNSVQSIVNKYSDIATSILESDEKSYSKVIDAYMVRLNALDTMLKDDDLSFDEKRYIMNEMREVTDDLDRLDTKAKGFRFAVLLSIAGVVGGAILALGSALGNNVSIESSDDEDDD